MMNAEQGKGGGGKAAETAFRVECIARLLLQGRGRRSIHDWVEKDSGWGISVRTSDRLIRRASKLFAREADRFINLRAEFQLAKGRLEALYKAALACDPPDIRGALACQRELIDLLGLAKSRPETTPPDETVSFDIVGVKDQDQDAEPEPAPAPEVTA